MACFLSAELTRDCCPATIVCFQSSSRAYQLPSGTKNYDSSGLASLRKTGQVAGAAGCRDQHRPLMLFRLDFEPEKIAPFQNLPVESAYAAKKRRHP
jgi:hypothetical protein